MCREESSTSKSLRLWHAGDRKPLESILERHLPWICDQVRKRLTRLLRRKGDTIDYVQDAVIQFLRFAPRFTIANDAHFRAILLRIVTNSLLDKHDWFTARRREIARERPLPNHTVISLDPIHGAVRTPSKSADRHEREAWIRLGLELLEPEDRDIIALRQWDGLTFPQIGERLGIPSNTARMRHNRAILRLTDKILLLKRGDMNCVY